MQNVTIYHNPRCSNSRMALELLQQAGITPRIINYLETPLTAPELGELVEFMQVPLRSLLREKEENYQRLGLENSALSEAELIAAVAAHPELLNRPIVVCAKGAALCRPPHKVLELLELIEPV